MKARFYFAIFIFLSISMNGQAPDIDWQKTYGSNMSDILHSMALTADGGYIFIGTSMSGISGDKTVPTNGVGDYWVIKTSSTGEIAWQKSLGGTAGEADPKIIATADGGFLICGSSNSNVSGNKTENSYGGYDYWVVKLNSLGNVEWDKTLGGDKDDRYPSAVQTTDGGYLIGGTSISKIFGVKTVNNCGYDPDLNIGVEDYWIVKLDSLGNILWQKTFGGLNYDRLSCLINTPDGGFLVGGNSYSNTSCNKSEESRGLLDYWVVKLDEVGNLLWQKTIGGSNSELLKALSNTDDGGYLLAGNSGSPISGDKTVAPLSASNNDFWIIKLDGSGNISWQKIIGGTGIEFVSQIEKDNNGNYVIGGISTSDISYDKTENSRGGEDFWVVKINSEGTVLWDKTIGGEQTDGIYGISYVPADNSFILAGSSFSSETGDKIEASRGLGDYWIVKLKSDQLATTSFNSTSISVYPNPTKNVVHIGLPQVYNQIQVTVFTVIGEAIQMEKYASTSQIDLDLKVSKGIYIMTIQNENKEQLNFKLVKN